MNYSSLLRSRRRLLCVVAREAGEKEKAESARDSIVATFISMIPSGPCGREPLPRRESELQHIQTLWIERAFRQTRASHSIRTI